MDQLRSKCVELQSDSRPNLTHNNQHFAIQSRLHTTFRKSAVFTNTPPSRYGRYRLESLKRIADRHKQTVFGGRLFNWLFHCFSKE